ncbi:MAG: hypothetical protein CMF31_10975 [Kordiimonas sp.]|nr:hypothetical protein [Kordiimonas sp.]
MTDVDQPDKIASLLSEIRNCRLCEDDLTCGPRPVLQLSAQAHIFICAQAPGIRVHESGLPFTDPSGDRLREWLGIDKEIFYDPQKVAIIPMGFCYPGTAAKGGDLPPRPECAATWHDEIFGKLATPTLKLVIGQYAHNYHLGSRRAKTLTQTVSQWRSYAPDIIPLPHPSPRNNIWLKKNPWFERDVLPYLRRRVAEILP